MVLAAKAEARGEIGLGQVFRRHMCERGATVAEELLQAEISTERRRWAELSAEDMQEIDKVKGLSIYLDTGTPVEVRNGTPVHPYLGSTNRIIRRVLYSHSCRKHRQKNPSTHFTSGYFDLLFSKGPDGRWVLDEDQAEDVLEAFGDDEMEKARVRGMIQAAQADPNLSV